MTAPGWHAARAPDLEDFERLARAAFDALPETFRARCGQVVIAIEDFPSQDVLDELGIESAFDLFGLYQGVDLTRQSVSDPLVEPPMVFLYRRPLLDLWADGEETLGHLVTHVLVHEIGHHFGLSDDDMEAIETAAG